MDIRGGCRFSSLVKQNKKAKICFVIHIAGGKLLLFYIYFVIVKQNFINGPVITIEARTILLLHINSARPSKQPLIVRTFLRVYMELGSYFVSARTNKRHHHLRGSPCCPPVLPQASRKLPQYQIVCVLLLQDLLQSCARGGRRRVEDMCYERRRAEACVDESAHHALNSVCVLLLQDLLHDSRSTAGGTLCVFITVCLCARVRVFITAGVQS